MRTLQFLVCALIACTSAGATLRLDRPAVFSGMCDASAAVAVSSNLFLVANDEDNILRLYQSDSPNSAPLRHFDLTPFLEVTGKSMETDLEAAARIGNRAFWMGSHGRNRNAKERLNRHRFFATDLATNASGLTVTPVGRPCKTLIDQLIPDRRYLPFGLAQASTRMPKDDDALDIEGLGATPDGHLLIGFRNPIPGKKALLAPLLNPDAVVSGHVAVFGDPILLDLDGLGIRDLIRVGDRCWIIAGPFGSGDNFRLYSWPFGRSDPERFHIKGLKEYNPEAIIHYPQDPPNRFQILSDDGTREIDGTPCKELPDSACRRFRSFWVSSSPP